MRGGEGEDCFATLAMTEEVLGMTGKRLLILKPTTIFIREPM